MNLDQSSYHVKEDEGAAVLLITLSPMPSTDIQVEIVITTSM